MQRQIRARAFRVVAMVVVVAVATATTSSLAAAQSAATPESSNAEYERAFRQVAGDNGDQLVEGLRQLEARLDIRPGNANLTAREVGRSGHDEISKALVYLAKLLSSSSFIAGVGFALSAVLKFFFHKLDPQPRPVSMTVVLLFIAAVLVLFPTLFPSVSPVIFGNGGKAMLEDIEPVLKDAKESARDGTGRLPADSEDRLRQVLQRRGLSGDALDAAVQVELLTAGVAIANARF